VKVRIPSPLHSYTAGLAQLECAGATLDEVLRELDTRYPGMRFRILDEQGRIRQHLRVFADGRPVTALTAELAGTEELLIVAALSGG
jgi:molybdopterin synthase sulfur carrier subunit